MNPSFATHSEEFNEGHGFDQPQQLVDTPIPQRGFVAPPTPGGSKLNITRSKLTASTETSIASSQTLRTRNVAKKSSTSRSGKKRIRSKSSEMRKQRHSMQDASSKSAAAALPPSSRDSDRMPPPSSLSPLQQSLAKAPPREMTSASSRQTTTSRQTTGTAPALRKLRRNRSGLSRAQQERLSASTPEMNHVHEGEPQPLRGGRRPRRATTESSPLATKAKSTSPAKSRSPSASRQQQHPTSRRKTGISDRSESRSPSIPRQQKPTSRKITDIKSRMSDRSDPSATRSRRLTDVKGIMADRSDPSASKSRRRATDVKGTMSDRSDPTGSVRRRKPMPKLKTRKTDWQSGAIPSNRDLHREEAQAAAVAMARKHHTARQQVKDEKDKWKKAWGRLSLSGQQFLEAPNLPEKDILSPTRNKPAAQQLESIDILKQLVSSEHNKDDDAIREGASAPSFTDDGGLLGAEEEDAYMQRPKSTSDLPKKQRSKGKRPKDMSSKPQRKAKRKSKPRKQPPKDGEDSLMDQSITISDLGRDLEASSSLLSRDLEASSSLLSKKTRAMSEASDILSMGISSSNWSSVRSTGVASAMSSIREPEEDNEEPSTTEEEKAVHKSPKPVARETPTEAAPRRRISCTEEVMPRRRSSRTEAVMPRRRSSRPVKELSSFLSEYDDLDALFSEGLEAVTAIEEASKETATKSSPDDSSPDDGQKKPVAVSNKPRRKSRASIVLRRFMKNFDDLDILFTRKVIKDQSREGESKHSRDDISIGSATKGATMESMLPRRRSLPDNLGDRDDLMARSPQGRPDGKEEQPNILKEMLTMSTDDLESLFASKQKSGGGVVSAEVLSNISEEPSGEHGRRSLSSFEMLQSSGESSQKSREKGKHRQSTGLIEGGAIRSSLTLEELISPELEDDTDEEDDPNKQNFGRSKTGELFVQSGHIQDIKSFSSSKPDPMSQSENLHEVRRKSNRDAVPHDLARRAPSRRRVERSLSPPRRPRPRKVQSEANPSTNQADKPKTLERRSVSANTEFGESTTSMQSSQQDEILAKRERVRRVPSRRRVERSISPPRRPRPRKEQSESTLEVNKEESRIAERGSPPGASKLGASMSSLQSSQRSLTTRSRPRERAKSNFRDPSSTTKERGRRKLPDRLKHGERSLSPQGRPLKQDKGLRHTNHSTPEQDNESGLNDTRRSLPTNLEVDSLSKSSTSSSADDVLETLLERYDGGLHGSGPEGTTASTTTDLPDVDYEAVEAMNKARQAKNKQEEDKERDREVNPSAAERSHSLAARAGAKAAAEDSENPTSEVDRQISDRSPRNPKRFPTRGTHQVTRRDRDVSPSRPLRQGTATIIKADEVFDPQDHQSLEKESYGLNKVGNSSLPSLKAFDGQGSFAIIKASDEEKAEGTPLQPSITAEDAEEENDRQDQVAGKRAALAFTAALDMGLVDPLLHKKRDPQNDELAPGAEGSHESFARSSYARDAQLSLPSHIGVQASSTGGRQGWNRYGSDSAVSLGDEASWRHFDDVRSTHSGGDADLRGFRSPDSRYSSETPPRPHRSPWGDHEYFDDEYYSHPNLSYGRDIEFPTINEFEAQYYKSHPHIDPGRSSYYGMYSSPDLLDFDQGYGKDSMRRHAENSGRGSYRGQRYHNTGDPTRPHMGDPRWRRGTSTYDGGRSMSLEDVFTRPPPPREAVMDTSRQATNRSTDAANRGESSGGSSSERRLATSVHGKESEWEDFTEVARSGALQSIPWRKMRGLSYNQHLAEVQRNRKLSALLLDESFHWRFHHAVSKGCPKSKNEFCCKANCCCKERCSPPWYHRPAQGVLSAEEKEDEDELPSYKGRTLQALTSIAASVRLEIGDASNDDGSLTYPAYDPKLDEKVDPHASGHAPYPPDDETLSFAD